MRLPTPFDWWRLSLNTAQMITEANLVIGYRMLGMAGLWAVTPSESRRMIQEKGPVYAKAAMAAHWTGLSGGTAEQVASAALKPIGTRTHANARRLGRRGPARLKS